MYYYLWGFEVLYNFYVKILVYILVQLMYCSTHFTYDCPYIYFVIMCTIMGPFYVHRLFWGLTPVHRMVPIKLYTVSFVLFWVILCALILWVSTTVHKGTTRGMYQECHCQ